MFAIGDTVKVLTPFDLVCPEEYVVLEVRTLADGSTAVTIEAGDFAPEYLEKV